MIGRFFIILLLFGGVWGQTHIAVQKLKQFLSQQTGTEMKIAIKQKQFDQISQLVGTMEISGRGQYVFDSEHEMILVNGTVIRSWNKMNQQLIIDETIPGEFSYFKLLSGDFHGVKFGKTTVKKAPWSHLQYFVKEMGIKGQIVLNVQTGQPRNISIEYGPDQRIDMEIKSISNMKGNSRFKSFNPNNLEVIDLRE